MENQNATLEQLTLSVIERGLSGGRNGKERIERIGDVLESATKLSESYPTIVSTITDKYMGLMKECKQKIKNYQEGKSYQYSDINIDEETKSRWMKSRQFQMDGNLLFAKVYESAIKVLSRQLSMAEWRKRAEELDKEAWNAYGLERSYTLFG